MLGVVLCGAPVAAQRRAQSRIDYSDFSHTTHVGKEKLACNACHKVPTKNWKEVRKGDSAFPDVAEFPEHDSCLSCHRQQFFARERPVPKICANCHVKATPNDTSRHPFPSLGEAFLTTAKAASFVSEFRVSFPHDKHSDADCADCHQTYQPQGKSDDEFITKPPKDIGDAFWLKKGTFKTRPLTHATCFTCHNQESELAPLPANCDTCHKSAINEKNAADFDQKLAGTIGVNDWWTLTAWRNRNSAGAFRHETHTDVKCAQCHNVTAMNTTSDATQKVPVKSCGGAEGCHITATLDDGGILNYEIDQKTKNATFVCTKCHLAFGNRPVPASHASAIPKAAVAVSFRKVFAHAVSPDPAQADYSQFKHDNRNHARLPCLLCHRREDNSPQPTLPGKASHTPCTGCHAQQFANPASGICTICHTDAQSGKVKAFPALRSFDARFDHAKHSGAACGSCHRRNRGGVGLTIPSRLNAHVTCFSCHTPGAQANGKNISSCSTCHQLGQLVRTSEQARAYRVGFSHASHEASEKLGCAACHQVRAGVARGRQVSEPMPLNHHAPGRAFSCASCHNGKRT
ncbi:MAG TPA: cytochrome c3 family protein, partial [Pyrinomonadaceae bacterium]|nr:cytochrome c3 family protein [Pyrinomonadaceae bacterium]